VARRENQIQNLKRYGLTQASYEDLLEIQEYTCAICYQHEERLREDGTEMPLSVDHCHKREAEDGYMLVRGLLCHRCNTALGLFREDPEVMQRAIDYLRNWSK
jgi:hypothetical protein